MIKVGVIGHTGRLGKQLVELLNRHHYAKIVYTESRTAGIKGEMSEPEIFFLALPYGESKKYLPSIIGKRVIDLSIDYRLDDAWVYGLPELNKDKIKGAKRVANPGCYATSIILGLAPIAKQISGVCVASTSGISGAGLAIQKQDNFLVYKEGREHQHIPEIEKTLGLEGILFVPQRIETTDRGIVSTIFADFNDSYDLNELYAEFYKLMPFVRLVQKVETRNVNGTNFCDIKVSRYGNKVIIISALDNLIKGGSGQAVQNFNLMYRFDEGTGLI